MWPGDVVSYSEYHETYFQFPQEPAISLDMPQASKSTMTGPTVNGDVTSSKSLSVGLLWLILKQGLICLLASGVSTGCLHGDRHI